MISKKHSLKIDNLLEQIHQLSYVLELKLSDLSQKNAIKLLRNSNLQLNKLLMPHLFNEKEVS